MRDLSSRKKRILPTFFAKFPKQTAEALAVLHSRGICHADFRPSNLFLELKSLDGLDEQEVILLLGEPETTDVHIRPDSRPTLEIPYAPKYLVYPVDFEDVQHLINPPRIRVIDFGQSFCTKRPPQPPAFGITANYAASEVILDNSGGMAMHLWSLACTIYEVRLGRRLFDVFQLVSLSKWGYVDEVASPLGRPPGQWAEFWEDEPETEAKTLADLLEKLLRYRQEERLGAQDVGKHAWFNLPF